MLDLFKTISSKSDLVGCIFAELLLRTPFFNSSGSELDQLGKIFHALGTPTEEVWPGMTSLPNYVEFSAHAAPGLSTLFSAAKEDALDLLSKCWTFNPQERISATEALAHVYFTNAPSPTPAAELPHRHLVSSPP